MANTSGVCTSFKVQLLSGIHAFAAAPARTAGDIDVLKGALFLASASPAISVATTVYATTGEVGNSGSYAAGGATVTNSVAPSAGAGTTAYWTPSASLAWTGVTFAAADTLLLYNSTQANKAIASFNFGSQSVTAGNFTLTMPTNDASTGLLRLA